MRIAAAFSFEGTRGRLRNLNESMSPESGNLFRDMRERGGLSP